MPELDLQPTVELDLQPDVELDLQPDNSITTVSLDLRPELDLVEETSPAPKISALDLATSALRRIIPSSPRDTFRQVISLPLPQQQEAGVSKKLLDISKPLGGVITRQSSMEIAFSKAFNKKVSDLQDEIAESTGKFPFSTRDKMLSLTGALGLEFVKLPETRGEMAATLGLIAVWGGAGLIAKKIPVTEAELKLAAENLIPKKLSSSILPKGLPEEIPGLRPSKVVSPKAQMAMEQTIASQPEELLSRTRGVITNEEAVKRASLQGITKEKLLSLPKGAILNQEQLLATRQLVAAEGEMVAELQIAGAKEALKGTGTEAQQKAISAMVDYTKLLAVQKGLGTEVARAQQSQKIVIDGISEAQRNLRLILSKADPEDIERVHKLLAQADLNDPKQVLNLLDKITKSSFLDKTLEVSRAVKLYTPSTHLVNTVVNTLKTLFAIPVKLTAASIDVALRPLGRERQVFFGESPEYLWGSIKGIPSGIANAFRTFTLDVSGLKGEQLKVGAVKGFLGKTLRTSFRALEAADKFSTNINNSANIHSLVYREAIKEGGFNGLPERLAKKLANPSAEILEEAARLAEKDTFRNKLGPFSTKVSEALNKTTVGKIISATVIPYLRTPTNLALTSIEVSPLGVVRLAKGLAKGGASASEAMATYGIGSSITGYFAIQSLNGNVTADAPRSKPERDAFFRQGKLPYSFKINGKWHPYQRILGPFAFPIRAGAIIGQAIENKDEKTMKQLALISAGKMVRGMADQTYVLQLNNLLNFFEDPEIYGERFARNLETGFIPSFIGAIARGTDPVVRRPTNLIENIQAVIPGQSKKLLPKRDAFGREIVRQGTPFQRLVSLNIPSKELITPVEERLSKLDIKIPIPSEMLIGRQLNPSEYDQYTEQKGKTLLSNLETFVSSPEFNGMNDKKQKDLIEALMRKVSKETKQVFVIPVEFRALGLSTDLALRHAESLEELVDLIDSPEYRELKDDSRRNVIKAFLNE